MEEIFVPLIIFSFIALIVKMILDYRSEKNRLTVGKSSPEGVTASDLQHLIEAAVREANEPLESHLFQLEEQLKTLERLQRGLSDTRASVKVDVTEHEPSERPA